MSRHFVRPLLAGVFLGLAALAPRTVNAQVLYDNGVPDLVNGYTVSPPYAVADRFTLGSSANVGSFSWYAYHSGPADPTILANYSWNIFADAAGAPGAVLFSGAAAAQTGTLTSYVPDGYSIYLFNTAVGSLPLSAGSYWLNIGNYASLTGGATGYWATSQQQGSAYQSSDGVTYHPVNVELAFSISGTQAIVTPEPATLSLLATGLLGIVGVAVRRRRA